MSFSSEDCRQAASRDCWLVSLSLLCLSCTLFSPLLAVLSYHPFVGLLLADVRSDIFVRGKGEGENYGAGLCGRLLGFSCCTYFTGHAFCPVGLLSASAAHADRNPAQGTHPQLLKFHYTPKFYFRCEYTHTHVRAVVLVSHGRAVAYSNFNRLRTKKEKDQNSGEWT